ncbi:MAG: heme exporter protein CcmD [Rhodospirillaceae bacterium]|nr:heme exporter protein CcmD [Rhodospirillaceae bacterium]
MSSLQDILNMGGYAAFVWPAYALAVIGLITLLALSWRFVASRQAELDRLRPPRPETPSTAQDDGANNGEA